MASGTVKCSVDCADDPNNQQISFIFSAVTKNNVFMFFISLFIISKVNMPSQQ
jgi:hypothetical protein